jgi:HK97 family phage portal protein
LNLLTRITDAFRPKAAEGSYRNGPWLTLDGWLPHNVGKYMNFWQMGYDPSGSGTSAMVEACVSAYAQTVAMCPGNHWRELGNGGRERVTTSALSRILRSPNDYQTISDFLLNAVRSLYLDGNAYALALRNDRFEISSLHLMHPRRSYPQVVGGQIYYALAGNDVVDGRIEALELDELSYVPARDVLHIRLHTPRHVLIGDTPLTAAALAIGAGNAMMAQSMAFYANQSLPSGVLQTDLTLTPEQVKQLRERWDEQSKGLSAGGTPILTSGLKFQPISVSQADAQFAEAQKMSDQQIAEVFRVPLAIIGSEAQPMGSTEALMNFWIGGGLGFALNQVELAIDRLFGLSKTDGEYSELDSSVLLRSAFKDRIDGLARAVQGGIFSPNEARALESLPAAKDGAEPRVQQQVVPLSAWDKALTKPVPAAEPPADKPTAANDDDPLNDDDEKALARFLIQRTMDNHAAT